MTCCYQLDEFELEDTYIDYTVAFAIHDSKSGITSDHFVFFILPCTLYLLYTSQYK
jgi:hypothetical protein